MNAAWYEQRKIDVPEERFDRLASPVSAMVVITTIDAAGRFNAAPVTTCLRNNHVPTCFEFTMTAAKHTAQNVVATGEFVVNVVPFDRSVLEKVQITSLPFPPGVDELEIAGLTALPSRLVRAPRIGECLSHFECRLEWSKLWLATRLTIVGRVVAASVNRDCIDEDGYVRHETMRTAHHCGADYGGKFLGGSEIMNVQMTYSGPDPKTLRPKKAIVAPTID